MKTPEQIAAERYRYENHPNLARSNVVKELQDAFIDGYHEAEAQLTEAQTLNDLRAADITVLSRERDEARAEVERLTRRFNEVADLARRREDTACIALADRDNAERAAAWRIKEIAVLEAERVTS